MVDLKDTQPSNSRETLATFKKKIKPGTVTAVKNHALMIFCIKIRFSPR